MGCNKQPLPKAPTIINKKLFLKNNRILVAAHRGAHQHYPENSIKALHEAIRIGVDIVEIDIRETKDGKLILMHDDTINRTTSGSGQISNINYKELTKYSLIDHHGSNKNQRIPLLETILKIAKNKIILDLDHKAGSLNSLIQIVNKYEMWDQVIFFRDEINYFEKIKKQQDNPIMMLRVKKKKDFSSIKNNMDFPIIHISHGHLKNIKNVKNYIWINTLSFEDKMPKFIRRFLLKRLIYKGVDIIQTDKPKWLLKYLRQKKLHH